MLPSSCLWFPIKNCNGYWISDTGVVWTEKREWFCGNYGTTKRMLPEGPLPYFCKQNTNIKRVKLCLNNGNYKHFSIHRLVMEHFNPIDSPEKYHIHHKDGDQGNNCIENLEWISALEHFKVHSVKFIEDIKRRQLGSGNTMAKLTEDQVLKIKDFFLKGMRGREIAGKFNIAESTVSNIKHGIIWSHLTGIKK